MEEKWRKKYNQLMKKGLKITLIVLAAIILVAAAAILAFYLRVSDPGNVFGETASTPAPEETSQPLSAAPVTTAQSDAPSTPSPSPTEEPTPTPMSEAEIEGLADMSFMDGRVNVLVLGIDKSVEREASGSFRTDTMILVTVNFKTMDVDMISIPRDSYVKLYGKDGKLIDEVDPFNKVNAAFSLGGSLKHGGYQSAMNTISALFGGVPVNYYLAVDMTAVKGVVDAMGGIDYDVDIDVYMNGRELHPGMQHLDGQAVLDYCRMRHGSSDVARADRQQRMLMALFNEMKTTGQIANLPKIYTAVQESVETDLTFEQICSLSLIALRMDPSQLERHMVAGQFQSIYARDCWLIDGDKLTKLLHDVFGAELTVDPDVYGDAIIANVAANHEAIAAQLYNANLVYSEAKTFMSSYKNALSDATYSLLSKDRSYLATYIRRECGPYLQYYTDALNSLLDSAYAEAGVARQAPQFMGVTGASEVTVTGGGSAVSEGGLLGGD